MVREPKSSKSKRQPGIEDGEAEPAKAIAADAVAAAIQANQVALAASYEQMREALEATHAALQQALSQGEAVEEEGAREIGRSMQAALEATRAALQASALGVHHANAAVTAALQAAADAQRRRE